MNDYVKKALSIALCLVIVLALLITVVSSFMSRVVFSQDYYNGIVAAPTYLSMVKDSINNEFKGQASYVGIPDDIFSNMLDDAALHLMLRSHIASVVQFLNYGTPIDNSAYPLELAKTPLYGYLEEVAVQNGFTASSQQYKQLDEVAEDSVAIIDKHVNLINLNLVKDTGAFRSVWSLFLRIRSLFVPSILVLIMAVSLMFLIYLREWRRSLTNVLIGFWLAGSLLLIPTLVLHSYELTRRLAIETAYLKHAVDSLLTGFNNYFMFWGASLFVGSTIVLIVLKFTERPVRRKRKISSSGSETDQITAIS